MLYKKFDLNNDWLHKEVFGSDIPKLSFSTIVGSYNYGLENENSDIDIKCFMFPSKQAIFQNHSLSLVLNNDESEQLKSNNHLVFATPKHFRHSDIKKEFEFKDIRELYGLLSCGSVNSLEILCSDKEYSLGSESSLLTTILAYKKEILLINLLKLPICINGLVCKVAGKAKDLDSLSGKKLAEALRYIYLAENMLSDGLSFDSFYNSIKLKNSNQRTKIEMLRANDNSFKEFAKLKITDFLKKETFQYSLKKWNNLHNELYLDSCIELRNVDESGYETYPFLSNMIQTQFNDHLERIFK